MKMAKEFLLFPNLPTELQDMIWDRAMPGPRIIHVQERLIPPKQFEGMFRDKLNGIDEPIRRLLLGLPVRRSSGLGDLRKVEDPSSGWKRYLFSTAQVPSLLQVCKASRECMKRNGYHLSFPTSTLTGRIYFNFQYDAIFLEESERRNLSHTLDPCRWNIWQFSSEDSKRVKTLVLDAKMQNEDYDDDLLEALRVFQNLDELALAEWVFSSSIIPDKYHRELIQRNTESDPWDYTVCNPEDLLFSRREPGQINYIIIAQAFKQALKYYACGIDPRPNFDDWAIGIAGRLGKKKGAIPRVIPKIHIVILATREGVEHRLKMNQGFRAQMRLLQMRRWLELQRILKPESPSWEYEDDVEAMMEVEIKESFGLPI